MGQISIAICWDGAEGHFRTHPVFASHESVSGIFSENTHILEHSVHLSAGMIRIQTVSAWNPIQMRMIQAVTSDISAPLPVTGLSFRRTHTHTHTHTHARAHTHTHTHPPTLWLVHHFPLSNNGQYHPIYFTGARREEKNSCERSPF